MVDLHCHILPGVDDGPATLAESLAMARQADEDGIVTVCATPHIRPDHHVEPAELAARVAALNEAIAGEAMAVRVVPGGELAEEVAPGIADEDLRLVTLGGAGGWVLLEPGPGPLSDALESAVETLAARGVRSVIAHPERHAAGDFFERLEALERAGALIQVTAALVAEGDAAPTLLELAGRGLVHLLGSDAHHPEIGRRVRLSDALARLAEVSRVRDHLGWIAETAPAAILRGEPVAVPF